MPAPRFTACLIAALLCAPAFAPAESGDSPSGLTLGSVHALIRRSISEAREWSPNARIYSIYGLGPKLGILPEEWTIVYGDPVAADGFFSIKFGDGVILEKHVCRGEVVHREYYWEGKLRNTMQGAPRGKPDYHRALQLGSEFIDAPDLDALLKHIGFKRPPKDRWTLELGRFAAPEMDDELLRNTRHAFTLDGTYRVIGAIPPNGYDVPLWIVDNGEDVIFLHAKSGKLINTRSAIAGSSDGLRWRVK